MYIHMCVYIYIYIHIYIYIYIYIYVYAYASCSALESGPRVWVGSRRLRHLARGLIKQQQTHNSIICAYI